MMTSGTFPVRLQNIKETSQHSFLSPIQLSKSQCLLLLSFNFAATSHYLLLTSSVGFCMTYTDNPTLVGKCPYKVGRSNESDIVLQKNVSELNTWCHTHQHIWWKSGPQNFYCDAHQPFRWPRDHPANQTIIVLMAWWGSSHCSFLATKSLSNSFTNHTRVLQVSRHVPLSNLIIAIMELWCKNIIYAEVLV